VPATVAPSPPDPTKQPSMPVFVFGALRSGTTVFRLMLNSHDRIRNPGETDFLFDYLVRDTTHPTGWRYRKDDMAENRIFRAAHLHLPAESDGLDLLHGLLRQLAGEDGQISTLNIHRNIHLLVEVLPEVRIIHMLRDPRDVARSSIGMGWAGTLYHGVDHWIRTETEWERVVDRFSPGQVLEIRYEALFSDIENNLRRVCDFLRIPFSAGMLRYHEHSSYSPPDSTLINQWRRKSSPAEISLVEGKAGHLMRARGYEPTGPGTRPGTVKTLGLALSNKFKVWRFSADRYGWPLVLAEKVTRRIGLRRLNQRFRRRIQDLSLPYLK
jgi:hypothetical protein